MATNRELSFGKIDGATLNTPYKQGLTVGLDGVIFNYGGWSELGLFATQLCLVNGEASLFVRACDRTVWTQWKQLQ
jgi:hypothetical protein